jgi:hypothetical protein
MGSMGRKKRRRTRSDGWARQNAPMEWDGLDNASPFTFVGGLKLTGKTAASAARARGFRGMSMRFLLLLPIFPAAIAVLLRDLWRWAHGRLDPPR